MRTYLAAIALATTILTAPAQAAVLLGQGPGANPPGGGSYGQFRFYDDFRLAGTSSITSLTWWGSTYAPSGTFEIRFTEVNGWYPGNVLYTATVTAVATNFNEYISQYSATFTTPFVASAETNYFLSIYRSDGYFSWAGATGPSAPGVFNAELMVGVGPTSSYLNAMNLSWQLEGNAVAPVPEPASWAMLLLGFGAIGGAMRRRTSVKLAFA